MSKIIAYPSKYPWFVDLALPFQLKDMLKNYPGSKWLPETKRWRFPVECLQFLRYQVKVSPELASVRSQLNGYSMNNADIRLHEYQRLAVQHALESGCWLFNDEMGLGKTPQAIQICKITKAKRVLVVCPAVVRQNWIRELKDWWPHHPEAASINEGVTRKTSKKGAERKAKAYAAPVQIVSYALVQHVRKENWDVIIFDEAHRLKDAESRQSKHCMEIRLANPKARVLGLTATLFPNKPVDCYNVVNTIWPERFSHSVYTFLFRYTNATQGEYGWEFSGLNPARGDELIQRLKSFSSRTTKLDVPHLVPPFDVNYMRIKLDRVSRNQGRSTKEYVPHTAERLGETLSFLGSEKTKFVTEWTLDAIESTSHVAILTHYKRTALQCAELLSTKTNVPVYHIDGDLPPDARHKVLGMAKARPSAIVVATMHSVGIGIDMTFCTQTIFAELYYRPETIIQALGRFSRLSGKIASSCTILIAEGTVEEVIAVKLADKMTVINSAIKAGRTESELDRLMGEPKTDQEIFAELNNAMQTYREENSYDI